jgi:hypothetical protein
MNSNTQGVAGRGKGLGAVQAEAVDHHHLARLDVADVFGVDDVEGAGLGSQDVGLAQPAQGQGAEAVGVAHADELALVHHHQRIGAAHLLERGHHRVGEARLGGAGHQVHDDLGIHAGAEDGAVGLQLAAQEGRVGQVAVVGDGDRAARIFHGDGLGIGQLGRPGGGIAHVADGLVPLQLTELDLIEAVRHQPHLAHGVDGFAVGGRDAAAFLAPVLKRVQAQIGHLGGFFVAPDAEHAAGFARLVVLGVVRRLFQVQSGHTQLRGGQFRMASAFR